MENKVTSHIIKGLIVAVILIVFDVILQKYGSAVSPNIAYLPTAFLTIGIIISCIIFAKQLKGKTTFGEVFAHGFKTTAVITLLMAVYTFFVVKFIYPPVTQADIEAMVKELEKHGSTMPQEAKRLAEESAKKAWIMQVAGVIFASMITGAIGAVIGAGVAKKNQ